jgi:hypothetical protein
MTLGKRASNDNRLFGRLDESICELWEELKNKESCRDGDRASRQVLIASQMRLAIVCLRRFGSDTV